MKRLHTQVTMEGTFEVITMSDLRTRPGEVLQQVELGKTYVIQRYGKDVAVLSKVPGVQLAIEVHPDGTRTHGP